MEFSVNKLLDELTDDMKQITCHIDDLFVMGYDQHFELAGNKLMCIASGDTSYACDLAVDYLHHVPCVGYVYGIRHRSTNVKGIFVYYTVNTITLT